jgi:hypothetical protein
MNYLIEYTKQNRKKGLAIAKGKNEREALSHAKFNIHTGTDFKVVGITFDKNNLSNKSQRK